MSARISPRLGLRVSIEGSGPDLLLLGGPDAPAKEWSRAAARLSSSHRVIRFEAGRPATREPWRVAGHLDRLLDVLDAAEADRVHVVAESLATPVALAFAAEHGSRVGSLTLSGGWARTDRSLRAVLRLWATAAERAGSMEELLTVVHRWTFGPEAWESGAVEDRIAAEARAEAAGAAASWPARREAFRGAVWAALDHDLAGDRPPAGIPTLVLVGDADPVAGLRYAAELAAAIPGAELRIIPGAAHHPWLERPDTAVELVLGFLGVTPTRALAAS